MSSPAPSNEASPCPAFAGSSPITSLMPSSSDSPAAKKIGHRPASLARSRPAGILDLPEEIHRLIVLALVELPPRPLLSQTQDDVYDANRQLVTLSLVSRMYKAIVYPILYEEIVVKTDWALARFFKTIKTMPALKDRVRVFWPLYWYSNSVVSPYFVGEFPRLQELSLMNDLKLLSTPYELDYNKFTGDDEEDAFLADIDNDNMDDIDAEIARELASPSTPLGRGDTTSVVQHKGKGKDKGKGKQRQVEPEPDVKSTPEIALKRAKARRISQQLKQMDQRRTERETKPTVVHLKTLEVTMNGLRELPRMNINLDQLETLAIVWVPKPAHEFHTPLPSLKTLYLSTYQIQSDREYEPQMLRVLKEYGTQLQHLHFNFRGIDDHIPSDVSPFCPNLVSLTIISPFFHSYCVYHGHPSVQSLRFGLPVEIVPAQLEEEALFHSTITKMDLAKWPKLKEIWLLELDWDVQDHREQVRVEEWEEIAQDNGWVLFDGRGRRRIGKLASVVEREKKAQRAADSGLGQSSPTHADDEAAAADSEESSDDDDRDASNGTIAMTP